ncbi:hypothetical protein AGMMS49950_07320 [Endomicrobiia bacterium]|nr:hypothetical protein AGMMS49950_07320 [Endomicrobiia bacterium]
MDLEPTPQPVDAERTEQPTVAADTAVSVPEDHAKEPLVPASEQQPNIQLPSSSSSSSSSTIEPDVNQTKVGGLDKVIEQEETDIILKRLYSKSEFYAGCLEDKLERNLLRAKELKDKKSECGELNPLESHELEDIMNNIALANREIECHIASLARDKERELRKKSAELRKLEKLRDNVGESSTSLVPALPESSSHVSTSDSNSSEAEPIEELSMAMREKAEVEKEFERCRKEVVMASNELTTTTKELDARDNDAQKIFFGKEEAWEIVKQTSINANKRKQEIEEDARKAAEEFDRNNIGGNISEKDRDNLKEELAGIPELNNIHLAAIAEYQKTIDNTNSKVMNKDNAKIRKKELDDKIGANNKNAERINDKIAANNEYVKKKVEFDKKWNDIRNAANNEASKAVKLFEQVDAELAEAVAEYDKVFYRDVKVKDQANDKVTQAVRARDAAERRDAAAKEAIFRGLIKVIANKDYEDNRVLQEIQKIGDEQSRMVERRSIINYRQTEIDKLYEEALVHKKELAKDKSGIEEELKKRDIDLAKEQEELKFVSKDLDDYNYNDAMVIEHKKSCIEQSEICIENLNKERELYLEKLAKVTKDLDVAGVEVDELREPIVRLDNERAMCNDQLIRWKRQKKKLGWKMRIIVLLLSLL